VGAAKAILAFGQQKSMACDPLSLCVRHTLDGNWVEHHNRLQKSSARAEPIREKVRLVRSL
jgi:hypothetical protein